MDKTELSRLSVFRPLWWILQSCIIGIWKMLLCFVSIWQALHILFTGTKHPWSVEFAHKFANHLRVWIEYTLWVSDKRPNIIEY